MRAKWRKKRMRRLKRKRRKMRARSKQAVTSNIHRIQDLILWSGEPTNSPGESEFSTKSVQTFKRIYWLQRLYLNKLKTVFLVTFWVYFICAKQCWQGFAVFRNGLYMASLMNQRKERLCTDRFENWPKIQLLTQPMLSD